jgi:hypothetical protein
MLRASWGQVDGVRCQLVCDNRSLLIGVWLFTITGCGHVAAPQSATESVSPISGSASAAPAELPAASLPPAIPPTATASPQGGKVTAVNYNQTSVLTNEDADQAPSAPPPESVNLFRFRERYPQRRGVAVSTSGVFYLDLHDRVRNRKSLRSGSLYRELCRQALLNSTR